MAVDDGRFDPRMGEATSTIRGVPLSQQSFTQASQTPDDSKTIWAARNRTAWVTRAA
jgi:hypothetical protein